MNISRLIWLGAGFGLIYAIVFDYVLFMFPRWLNPPEALLFAINSSAHVCEAFTCAIYSLPLSAVFWAIAFPLAVLLKRTVVR